MISDYFQNESSEDIWLTGVYQDVPIAIVYCAPERMTEGTYNLYLIAVHKVHQGQGIGAQLIGYIEDFLIEKGHRVLLVETSGSPDFEITRKFYEKNGYLKEATIRDFYKEGKDKFIFYKKLGNSTQHDLYTEI